MCLPMEVMSTSSHFTNDYLRYGYIYLMRHKSESFDKFKEFKAEAEKQLGRFLKKLQSDRGGEYLSGEFKQYLMDNGMISHLTTLGTPQQNGVAERKNRTLLDMVRFMLNYSILLISFWGYALQITMYLLNVVPSKSAPKAPRELWIRCKPSLNHIQKWGCLAYVLKHKTDKLEARSKVYLFVGYPEGMK